MTDHPQGRGATGEAGWLVVDDDLQVVAADGAACLLIGAPRPDALTGRSLASLVAGSDAAALEAARDAIGRGVEWRARLRFTFTPTPVEVDATASRGGDSTFAFIRLEAPANRDAAAPDAAPALQAQIDAHEALREVAGEADAARAVLQAVRSAVVFDWAAVIRFTSDGVPRAEAVAVYPSPMAGVAPGTAWSPLSAEEARLRVDGEPSLTNDASAGGRSPLDRLVAFGMRSKMLVPLYARERVVGAAALFTHAPRGFAPVDGVHAEAILRPLGARLATPAPVPQPTAVLERPAVRVAEQATEPPASPAPSASVTPPTPATDHAPRLAVLSDLVAGVAHELNNPLTSILGYSQILSSLDGMERDEAIATIESEAERASRIVRNLLSFARQRPAERQPLDLERVIRRVVDIRRYALEMDDIRVVPRFGHVPDVVGDEAQFEDVFLHLLSNAQQALQPRGGEVTITTSATEDRVYVTVTDNGPGIPEEVRGRVFEPFYTTREVGSGQGMGLAIVYGVVTRHGGRTWVEAAPGGGTQVVMELPVARQPSEPGGIAPAVPGTRILVVDDEAPIRALTQEILVSAGYDVAVAANGTEAVRRLEVGEFDLVIADMRMPEMGGAALYEVIRQRWPRLAERMLIVTGDIEGDRNSALIIRDRVRYLEKPFDTRELLGAISALLEGRRQDVPAT